MNIFFSKAKAIISLFIAFCIMISCQEEAVNTVDNLNKSNLSETYQHDYTEVVNNNNPFDSMGVVHNLALDYLIDNYTFFDSLTSESVVNDGIYDYFYNRGWAIIDINAGIDGGDEFHSNTQSMTQSEWIDSVCSSDSAETYLLILLENIADYTDSTDLTNYFNTIKLFESKVNYSTAISSSDKHMILGAAAVARYSMQYWYEVWTDQQHPWYNVPASFIEKIKPNPNTLADLIFKQSDPWWWKVTGVVVGDAAGFCGGYWDAGRYGANVYVGGAIGAVCGSAMAAVTLWFEDICDCFSDLWDSIFG